MRIVDIDKLPRHGGRGGLVYWKDIEGQATEIVECKDCKYYNGETKGCTRNPSVEKWENDDYCSYGERREE